jgi:hypothetical protein
VNECKVVDECSDDCCCCQNSRCALGRRRKVYWDNERKSATRLLGKVKEFQVSTEQSPVVFIAVKACSALTHAERMLQK